MYYVTRLLARSLWQQVKVLTERITQGAKISGTLACPASLVLHKRLNEAESHLQLPSWEFWGYEKSPRVTVELSTP